MADGTAIEWTAVPDGQGGYKKGASWNPLRGCTEVSDGCTNCYAASVALRFGGAGKPYEGLAVAGPDGHPQWTGQIMLVPGHLTDPLRWREPRGVFVNSMSDLFHPDVPVGYIDRVFAVMAAARRHTFQILTKRPQIAANYLGDPGVQQRIERAGEDLAAERGWCNLGPAFADFPWPLPHVWLGTSVEDQRATSRIKALLRAPAAVRFLSCEPLLGPLDIAEYLLCAQYRGPEIPWPAGTIHGVADPPRRYAARIRPRVDWVIVGGESGRYHRPLDPDWARSIREQCVAADVPLFFKQVGGLTPKSGGDLLDGLAWKQFPEVRS